MVTVYKSNATTKVYYFRGLTTDTKPTSWQGSKIAANSIFLEMDATPTPKAYRYTGSAWVFVKISTDILNDYYTAQQVDEKIALAQLEGAGVDTSNFVVQSQLATAIQEQFVYTDAVETKHNEFEESLKSDFEGKKHDTVAERLTEDFGALWNRVNEASMMPYESANGQITAQNTYKGITKDTVIKGKTWQNLSIVDNFTCSKSKWVKVVNGSTVKPNTVYTAILNIDSLQQSSTTNGVFLVLETLDETIGFVDINFGSVTAPKLWIKAFTFSKELKHINVAMNGGNDKDSFATINGFKVLEGDYTNTPISELPTSVTGIESVSGTVGVKSVGKNILPEKKYTDYDFYIPAGTKCRLVTKDGAESKGGNVLLKDIDNKDIWCPINAGETRSLLTLSRDAYKINNMLQPGVEHMFYIGDISDYEERKEHTTSYELAEPLRSLPNGVCDEIVDGKLIRRVYKQSLTANAGVTPTANTFTNTCQFNITPNKPMSDITTSSYSCAISNFFKHDELASTNDPSLCDYECFRLYKNNMTEVIVIKILQSRLSEVSVAAFTNWLQSNNVEVYYELKTPIVTPIDTQELKTYDGTTHVIVETDNIKPVISTKVPSNIAAVASSILSENQTFKMALNDTTDTVSTLQEDTTTTTENVEMLTECVIEMADIVYA